VLFIKPVNTIKIRDKGGKGREREGEKALRPYVTYEILIIKKILGWISFSRPTVKF